MTLDDGLRDLVARFGDTLSSKEGLLECFCRYGVQLEGWLKGELLYFLDKEKEAGWIGDFDREVSSPAGYGRKRVDLKVNMATLTEAPEIWIELKHWLIGYQRGSKYNARFYFGDSSSVGIRPDAEKLSEIPNGRKFILVLTTANPGALDWLDGIDLFNRKFPPFYLKSFTDAADFPSSYYLGLMEVTS